MNEQELRKKYYSMLMQFTQGTLVSKSRLLRLPRYSKVDIEFAEKQGLIEIVKVNDIGMPVYGITPYGKQVRDN